MAASTVDYRALSIPDRIRLVQEIWDSIIEDDLSTEFPPSQQRELDQRLRDVEQSPGELESWDEVRRDLERDR